MFFWMTSRSLGSIEIYVEILDMKFQFFLQRRSVKCKYGFAFVHLRLVLSSVTASGIHRIWTRDPRFVDDGSWLTAWWNCSEYNRRYLQIGMKQKSDWIFFPRPAIQGHSAMLQIHFPTIMPPHSSHFRCGTVRRLAHIHTTVKRWVVAVSTFAYIQRQQSHST